VCVCVCVCVSVSIACRKSSCRPDFLCMCNTVARNWSAGSAYSLPETS